MPFIVLDPALAAPAPAVTFGDPLTDEGYTLNQFREELMFMLGDRADIPTSRLDRWINTAYVDICTSLLLDEAKFSFAITTVVGQPLYNLPPAVYSTISADVVDAVNYPESGGYPLDKKSLDWYRAQRVLSGQTQAYFKYNKLFVLYPTPDAVRTVAVDVIARPGYLVEDTDSPILPIEWHFAILLKARAVGHSSLLEPELAMAATNEFVNYVRQRTDMAAAEDMNRIPLSAVPKTSRDVRKPVRNLGRRAQFDLD